MSKKFEGKNWKVDEDALGYYIVETQPGPDGITAVWDGNQDGDLSPKQLDFWNDLARRMDARG